MPPQPGFSNAGRSRTSSRKSLLDTRPLSSADILTLFQIADQLNGYFEKHGNFFDPKMREPRNPKTVCCLFFEPSTRTRMSFQAASYRLGHQVLTMEMTVGSSLSKGESYTDTVLNIAAMKPDVLIVRYGKSPELDSLLPTLPMSVINAGSGTTAHPTQALLDAYTIYRERGSLIGQRVLIVGDIIHSRVAKSNFDVLMKLGAEVAVCGPEQLMPPLDSPEYPGKIKIFTNLDEALSWATVYMGLRIQLERHDVADLQRDSMTDYHRQFGLGPDRLKKLAKDVMIMHPGPINHGVEFSHDVMSDSRSRILEQVSNGVLIRAALLSQMLSESQTGKSEVK